MYLTTTILRKHECVICGDSTMSRSGYCRPCFSFMLFGVIHISQQRASKGARIDAPFDCDGESCARKQKQVVDAR